MPTTILIVIFHFLLNMGITNKINKGSKTAVAAGFQHSSFNPSNAAIKQHNNKLQTIKIINLYKF